MMIQSMLGFAAYSPSANALVPRSFEVSLATRRHPLDIKSDARKRHTCDRGLDVHEPEAVLRQSPNEVAEAERCGTPRSGRIVTLFIGQGYGFIRLTNNREVYFHRSGLREGTSFNDFAVGDAVSFELLEDTVSGPRRVHVERRRSRR